MARLPLVPRLTNEFGDALRRAEVRVLEHYTQDEIEVYAAETGGSVLTQPLATDAQGEVEVWTEFSGLLDVVFTDGGLTVDRRGERRLFTTPVVQTRSVGEAAPFVADYEQFQADSQTPYIIQYTADESLVYTSNARFINIWPHADPTESLRAATPLGSLIDPYVLPPLGTGDHDIYKAHFRFARPGVYRVVQTYHFHPGSFDWTKISPIAAPFWTTGDPPDAGFSAWGANMNRPHDASGPHFSPFAGGRWWLEVRSTHAVVDLDPEDIPSYYPGSYPYGLAMDDYVVPTGWDYYCSASLTSTTDQFALGTVPTIDTLDFHILRIA